MVVRGGAETSVESVAKSRTLELTVERRLMPPRMHTFDRKIRPRTAVRSSPDRGISLGGAVRWLLTIALVGVTLTLTPWTDRVKLNDGRSGVVVSETPASLNLRVGGHETVVSSELVSSRVRRVRSRTSRLDARWLVVASALGLAIVYDAPPPSNFSRCVASWARAAGDSASKT